MSEAYVVLARRYRSATFDELVGQEPISRTLKNAVRSGRVAHAFLFTGTRGVGKTSAARILAKAINCPNRREDGNPCGECNSCMAIARGDDLDVIEIDGASNRGIDNIRDLRQAAGVRPARSPYKIYIIDEVHMVTKDAFNALLKTLEEPPAHVKFIFATTEIEKVPATILSRCQRFDFKPIPLARIVEHLKEVLEKEHVSAEPDALHRIARLGAGSMRDALSLLDRVLSLGEKRITEKTLEELLGKPQEAAVAQLVTALANSDAAAAITRADELFREGMGAEQILSELIEFFRSLMIVAACGGQTEILDVPNESRAMYADLAKKYDPAGLVHMIALCDAAHRSMRGSTMQRPLFDALLVRLALSEQFSTVRELLADGAAAGDAAKKKSDSELTASVPAKSLPPLEPPPPAPPVADEPDGEESIYDTMKAHILAKKEELEKSNTRWKPGSPGGARPTPVNGVHKPAAPEPVEIVRDLSNLPAIWEAARQYLSIHARLLENVLGGCGRIAAVDQAQGELTLTLPASQRNFTNDKARAKLEEAIRAVTEKPWRLKVEFIETSEAAGTGAIGVVGPGAAGASGLGVAQRVPPELLEAIRNQPLIKELAKRFDAAITQVEVLSTKAEDAEAEV